MIELAHAEARVIIQGQKYRLRIDIGGTFSDLILLRTSTGKTWMIKILLTSKDPSIGFKTAIMKLFKMTNIAPIELSVITRYT